MNLQWFSETKSILRMETHRNIRYYQGKEYFQFINVMMLMFFSQAFKSYLFTLQEQRFVKEFVKETANKESFCQLLLWVIMGLLMEFPPQSQLFHICKKLYLQYLTHRQSSCLKSLEIRDSWQEHFFIFSEVLFRLKIRFITWFITFGIFMPNLSKNFSVLNSTLFL